MFSVKQKREIAEAAQIVLRNTKHPELSEGERSFRLMVLSIESWNCVNIQNNGKILNPVVNPWSELQDT